MQKNKNKNKDKNKVGPETRPPQKTAMKGERHILYSKPVQKLAIDNPTITEATLYLSTFDENKVTLAEILNELKELTPEDNINLIINSPGGFLNEGKSIINTIESTGALITTELLSDADSMAAIMFCIGDKRIVYENSSLMYHTFSGGYVGKGGEMEDYISHMTKANRNFFKAHIIGLTEEEIKRMEEGKEWWFNTKEMCERGIATHVNVKGLIIPAARYLKLLKKVKKAAKKIFKGKDKVKVKSLNEGLSVGIDSLSPIADENKLQFQEIQEKLTKLIDEYEYNGY
jgi:ATP-dependent protease ClpP protease subunit